MKSFTYTITDPEGLHARPAGILVKKVKEFPCTVQVEKDGKSVDARKMFALMGLGIKNGESITITINGEQEEAAVLILEEFFKDNL